MESNYLHGKLGSKKPMKPKPYRLDKLPSGGGGSTIPGNTGNQPTQEIKNLERDIEVLNRKYSDLTNIPLENSRNIHLPIIPGAKPQDEKSKLFDELLTRIISLDREVLRMTSEDMPRLVRRNSKPSADSLGNDLIHLPTHLILLDRLMDFHTLLKRENALKEGRGGSQGGMRGDVNPSSSPQVFTLLAENESLKKQLEEVTKDSLSRYSHLQRAHDKLTQELLQLQQSALQSSVDLDSHIQQSLNEKSVRESLRKEFEDERQIWRNREASLAEEVQELKTQKDVLKQNYLQKEREWQQRQEKEELMEQKWSKEREKLEEELERQRQREQQQLLTSDGQYTDEATKEIFLLKREVQQLKEKCQRREEKEESLRQCRRAVAEALRLIHDSQLSPSHRDGEDQRLQQEQQEEQKEVGEDDKESYQNLLPRLSSLLSQYRQLQSAHVSSQRSQEQTLQQLTSLQESHQSELATLQDQFSLLQQQELLHRQQLETQHLHLEQSQEHSLKVLVEYQEKIDQLAQRNSDCMKQLEWYQQVERTLGSQVQEFHSAYLEVDEHRKNLEYVISILREEEVRAQEMIDDLQHKLTELSKNTDKGVGRGGNII